MSRLVVCFLFFICLPWAGVTQSSEKKAIKQAIAVFARAADQSDVATLDACLGSHFLVVMNRLFGSKQVDSMPKQVYLEKIKNKEFGGQPRVLKVEDMIINGTVASAKVRFSGSKLTFISILTLVKDEAGIWKIIQDAPILA